MYYIIIVNNSSRNTLLISAYTLDKNMTILYKWGFVQWGHFDRRPPRWRRGVDTPYATRTCHLFTRGWRASGSTVSVLQQWTPSGQVSWWLVVRWVLFWVGEGSKRKPFSQKMALKGRSPWFSHPVISRFPVLDLAVPLPSMEGSPFLEKPLLNIGINVRSTLRGSEHTRNMTKKMKRRESG